MSHILVAARGAAALTLWLVSRPAGAQTPKTVVPAATTVSGAVTVTNKGISVIPTFTLGKPAAIIDLTIARRGVSFEPQFRVGLDGKPWSFIFWARYQVHQGERVQVQVGAHPALLFRSVPTLVNGAPTTMLAARRYLAAELNANYVVHRDLRVGTYFLQSYGVESDAARHTHFAAARATANVHLTDAWTVRLAPQVYALIIDAQRGTYMNGTVFLLRQRLPVNLSVSANQAIRSDVTSGRDVLWNVSLTWEWR